MRQWALFLLTLLGTAACDDDLDGIEDPGVGAVYTMNNSSTANFVLVFKRFERGGLTLLDSIPTGGRGTGPDPAFGTDPLGSQDALILSDDRQFLFAVDAGSNAITSFRVAPNGLLSVLDRIDSGGIRPVSLASRGDLLYVVNSVGGGNISGYRVGDNGTLSALPGTILPLSQRSPTEPASISLSPDRRTLVVTEKATDRLTIFNLTPGGVPESVSFFVSPTRTPCGAEFDQANRYFVAEGNININPPQRQAVLNGSSVSSFFFNRTSDITELTESLPTTETGSCRVLVTPDGRFVYTSNITSGTITGFLIRADGTLRPLTADGRTGVLSVLSNPLDMATARQFLYVLTPGVRSIGVFEMETDGDLILQVGASPVVLLAVSSTGLAAF
jgi:6-phosphogluconolactonase (cycloisomerase 2 family)